MENERNHLLDILILINNLQRSVVNNIDNNNSCTKPILGPVNNLIYNTRPVSFYLCNGQELSIEGDNDIASVVFRVENVNNSCVTVRLLNIDEQNNITSTNEFATINIDCIAALRCLSDVSLIL